MFLTMAFSRVSFSCIDGQNGFMPKNDLKIGIHDKMANDQLTEEVFNKIIDKAELVYVPLIKKLGGTLKVNRNWTDGTVNASAMRKGLVWEVNMYGGLARHQFTTPDAFALVLCHELGHHMGGAPKVAGFFNRWASNEGQSDYYATGKCFRLIYSDDNNQEMVASMKVPAAVSAQCQAVYSNPNDSALCVRMSMGGYSLAQLLGSLGGNSNVDFTTPDPAVVTRTNDRHPKAQCRLDTYFQGSLCDRPMDEAPSNNNPNQGFCSNGSGHKTGIRPLCWYFPKE